MGLQTRQDKGLERNWDKGLMQWMMEERQNVSPEAQRMSHFCVAVQSEFICLCHVKLAHRNKLLWIPAMLYLYFHYSNSKTWSPKYSTFLWKVPFPLGFWWIKKLLFTVSLKYTLKIPNISSRFWKGSVIWILMDFQSTELVLHWILFPK